MQTVTHEIDAAAIDAEVEGQTVAGRWLDTVAAIPDRVALRARDGDALGGDHLRGDGGPGGPGRRRAA